MLVDLNPRPGRFLLTGSSRVLALRSLPDALPGRMEVIELWPFSQGEMHGGSDRFIDAAFRHGVGIEHSSRLRKRDYLELAAVGGFPEAVRRPGRRCSRRAARSAGGAAWLPAAAFTRIPRAASSAR